MSHGVPQRILVGWRPESAGTEALHYAAWLARTGPVTIRVATVIPRTWPMVLSVLSGFDTWAKEEADRSAAAARAALKEAGVPKSALDDEPTVAVTGTSEAAGLSTAATDFDADLIILGSHGSAAKGYFRMGSTADALLHYSPIPIGLAPRHPKLSKRGITRICCPYVDTAQSHTALARAADMAMAWDLPLRLLAFVPSGAAFSPVDAPMGNDSNLMVEWQEQAMATLDRGRDRALTRYPDIHLETEIGSGPNWAAALDTVKWKKGDLLVTGSSALGPFARVFIGSSTSQILRHCPTPIYVTPA
ncbi:universal stress protein [Corynebacterium ulceribovis]|uniref:universal stress protein n=1 Tax=Corynebacterium ulceribovis TaxID=487732 RepID=UPI00036068F4|nr:universal stress protein [Corynebacterium ulceribovis]